MVESEGNVYNLFFHPISATLLLMSVAFVALSYYQRKRMERLPGGIE